MKMKYLLLAAAALMSASQANATAFIVDYSGTSATYGSFTGHLTGDVTGGVITTIGGTLMSGIVPVVYTVSGLSSYGGATQHLNFSSPYTDFGGISFSTIGGGDFNIYSQGGYFQLSSNLDPVGYPSGDAPISTFTVTAVPEPATWLMMLGGFFMVGFGLRSRKRAVLSPAFG